jgi:general secretion pathway protein K
VDEVSLVLGMTPEIFKKVAPYLTVYSAGGVNPALADPVVQSALQASSATAPQQAGAVTPPQGVETVTIEAHATGPGGSAFTRRAVVTINIQAGQYTIYEWYRGPA